MTQQEIDNLLAELWNGTKPDGDPDFADLNTEFRTHLYAEFAAVSKGLAPSTPFGEVLEGELLHQAAGVEVVDDVAPPAETVPPAPPDLSDPIPDPPLA